MCNPPTPPQGFQTARVMGIFRDIPKILHFATLPEGTRGEGDSLGDIAVTLGDGGGKASGGRMEACKVEFGKSIIAQASLQGAPVSF